MLRAIAKFFVDAGVKIGVVHPASAAVTVTHRPELWRPFERTAIAFFCVCTATAIGVLWGFVFGLGASRWWEHWNP